jgi:ABC transporter substrate binding protein
MAFDETDPEGKARLSGFTQGLSELGWTDSRNLRMEVRWAIDNVDRVRALAKQLVDLQPDVILGGATPATAALQRETRTIPIVFASVSDPVGSGFVAGLPRPGGNITGFSDIEASMGGQMAGIAHGDRARRQTGRSHVQSRHGSLCRIVLPALIRGCCPIVQGGGDHSARS